MIKTLQRRLIAIAMASMAFVLAMIIAAINVANWISVNETLNERMDMLAEMEGNAASGGDLLSDDEKELNRPDNQISNGKHGSGSLSAEAPYDTRYFTVVIKEDGSIYTIDTSNISAITSDDAAEYASSLFDKGKERGYISYYKFRAVVVDSSNGLQISSGEARTLYIFMDCERELGTLRSYFLASIAISLLGLFLVFIMVVLFSQRAMEPMRESYAKQKQFITDAGHEIKTPLTIIDANTEIIEMMDGENEWTRSTRNQIARLTELTEKMVFLTRMDEDDTRLQMLDFSLSDAVLETAEPFAAVARTRGLTLDIEVEPNITYHGDEASIRQLVSILLDNSMKYSSENGAVRISLKSAGRTKRLVVWNTVYDIEPGNHDEFFDRFYRRDSSRSQEIKGHGIGLSVAQAIAKAHGGKLTAKSEDGASVTFVAVL